MLAVGSRFCSVSHVGHRILLSLMRLLQPQLHLLPLPHEGTLAPASAHQQALALPACSSRQCHEIREERLLRLVLQPALHYWQLQSQRAGLKACRDQPQRPARSCLSHGIGLLRLGSDGGLETPDPCRDPTEPVSEITLASQACVKCLTQPRTRLWQGE
ncbi:MAG: hypothetical protein FRX49_01502 [Trebouxia sp. A1-2]|nr:MAG: hypothetical protein FRX49_01502 [Trebouxia sp. A1-2]